MYKSFRISLIVWEVAQNKQFEVFFVRKLNSIALRQITVGVKAFGSEKEKVIKIKE